MVSVEVRSMNIKNVGKVQISFSEKLLTCELKEGIRVV
jgi:hypothetical protein